MKTALATLVVALFALHGSLLGQCAMCYQTDAAQGPKAMQALNLGILLLIVPVVSIIGCISVVAYRYRDPGSPTPTAGDRSAE